MFHFIVFFEAFRAGTHYSKTFQKPRFFNLTLWKNILLKKLKKTLRKKRGFHIRIHLFILARDSLGTGTPVFHEREIYKCRVEMKFFWENFIMFVFQKLNLVIFGDTFTKTAEALGFSAVVDLDMLRKQRPLFVVLKAWGQFWWGKIAILSKTFLFSKSHKCWCANVFWGSLWSDLNGSESECATALIRIVKTILCGQNS